MCWVLVVLCVSNQTNYVGLCTTILCVGLWVRHSDRISFLLHLRMSVHIIHIYVRTYIHGYMYMYVGVWGVSSSACLLVYLAFFTAFYTQSHTHKDTPYLIKPVTAVKGTLFT